jgi:hypothetical protein
MIAIERMEGDAAAGVVRTGAPVAALVFAPDGALFAAGQDRLVRRIAPDGTVEIVSASGAPSRALAISSDGEVLGIGDDDGVVRALPAHGPNDARRVRQLLDGLTTAEVAPSGSLTARWIVNPVP